MGAAWDVRVLEEVERLLDVDAAGRARALTALAREDRALADEVRALLTRADEDSGDDGLVERARRDAAALFQSSTQDGPPAQVAGFRVLGVLGRGGMGVVYRAEQAQPRREVALKLLLHHAGERGIAARFAREAEALARLSHPCIARIYDAGVDEADGAPRPWISMELVEGLPLTDHAARAGLDLRARVRLLAAVCAAVAHAHAKGVLHRDLKPANVLVDVEGRPRVLDFGVARLLGGEEGTGRFETEEGRLVGTLAYMSPEQAAGAPLDPRSDVYALGLLAYELLTGARAQELSGLPVARALQQVQRAEPRRPGDVDPRLRGDLETILRKALEKDPARRYASAEALGADLRRFLSDEPIAARPPTTAYQLVKFARRHRALVAGTAATLLALAGGLATTTVQAARAEREAELARASERRASEAVRVLLELFSAGKTHAPEGLRPVHEVVLAGRPALEEALRDAPLERARLLTELGEAVLFADDRVQAMALLREALALRRAHAREDEAGEWRIHLLLGSAAHELGLVDEAEPHMRQAIELLEARGGRELWASLQLVHSNLATLLCDRGRHAEAAEHREAALETVRREAPEQLPAPGLEFWLAAERHHSAPTRQTLDAMRAALERALSQPLAPEARARMLKQAGTQLLLFGRDAGQPELVLEARGQLDEAVFLLQGLAGRALGLAETLEQVVACEEAQGELDAMLALQQESVRLLRGVPGAAVALSDGLARLGRCYFARQDFTPALAALEEARALHPLERVEDGQLLADMLQQAGRPAVAVEVLCALKERALARPSPDPAELAALAALDARLSVSALLSGDAALAAPILGDLLEERRRRGAPAVLLASSEQLYGWALLRLGRVDEAGPLIERGSEVLFANNNGPEKARGQLCVRSLVELAEARGRPQEAARWRAQLVAGR